MDSKLLGFLKELENFGVENDREETNKSKRMRNVTLDTAQFLSFMASLIKATNILEDRHFKWFFYFMACG
ncbi:hypothetical protein [Neobacillus terrae]|uniref:hypothetical protein n=1 Tax=Neobacillus terrae TaxID=3034837 RepID=UPI00140E0169|nr:hypothetical protein [Neobacillus terrae]NHM30891.1 hypothetical protein [Neobacillus terrae]